MSLIKDPRLAPQGKLKIEWAERHMRVLLKLREEFKETKPLRGVRVGMALHVTKETAALVRTLSAGGAEVAIASCNPLSTQDDVAAALAAEGIEVFAWRGETREEYYENLNRVLDTKPKILIDDGADLITLVHREREELAGEIKGGCEETTTGVNRLRAMEREGALRFPVVDVNDALTKFLFDNRYGTGQSVVDGIMRATNLLLAGKTVVVCGYGWCGRGIAMRSRGLGANVVVTEIDPIRALEAAMDGFRVMPIREAAKCGDIFITATGNVAVIRKEHMELMKDGAILANAGHFDVEIDAQDLRSISEECRAIKENVEEFLLKDGRRLYLLASGRLVNLVAAEGHPSEVMDMSFSNQALAVKYLLTHDLKPSVHKLPRELDEMVARLKLEVMGIEIDSPTKEQQEYMRDWGRGT